MPSGNLVLLDGIINKFIGMGGKIAEELDELVTLHNAEFVQKPEPSQKRILLH
jgi:hypothetical protein